MQRKDCTVKRRGNIINGARLCKILVTNEEQNRT